MYLLGHGSYHIVAYVSSFIFMFYLFAIAAIREYCNLGMTYIWLLRPINHTYIYCTDVRNMAVRRYYQFSFFLRGSLAF